MTERSGAKNGEKRRRQLAKLFAFQQGRCYWCKEFMFLDFTPPQRHASVNPRKATIDHLDDKFSPMRGRFPEQCRRVAACWICNNKRGAESSVQVMIENPKLIWRRTGRRPLMFIDIWEGFYAERKSRRATNYLSDGRQRGE